MKPSRTVIVMLLLVVMTGGCAESPQRVAKPTGLYDSDPQHLWNRLHAAFFCRLGPDGKVYGEDRLEPLLWMHSKHLLQGDSFDAATAVLNEFDRQQGDLLVQSPLKRAILQRDLWLVANWLSHTPDSEAKLQLQRSLGRVIRQLALTSDEIAKLPDNYATAAASQTFTDRFDAGHPHRSYLPQQLFDPEGPWVCIGCDDGPIAPQHLREDSTSPFTNSTFLILLKLPEGRRSTLEFLKQLAAFDPPYLVANPDEKSKRSYPYLPNAALPAWPKGTEVALVRRALLINSKQQIVASPLTESIQLRVMRTETPVPSSAMFDMKQAHENWAFFEFQFRRADLFSKSPIGLRDVSADRDFKTGFMSHPSDEFDDPSQPTKAFPVRAQPFEHVRDSCLGCHQLPGLFSFNSLAGFQFGRLQMSRDQDGHDVGPFSLKAASIQDVEAAAVQWKESQSSWQAVRKELAE